MAKLTYKEKLLLYVYICRQFPSVVSFEYLEEEGLDKALLSFLNTIKDEPWKYLQEGFLDKVDKTMLKNLLSRILTNISGYYYHNTRERIKTLCQNLIDFTEEKQQEFSELEKEKLTEVKNDKLQELINRVNKLTEEGKIKI